MATAVDDNLFLGKRVKEFSAVLNQASLDFVRIYGTHQSLESIIRRWTAVRTVCKESEITRPIEGELAHVQTIIWIRARLKVNRMEILHVSKRF